MASVIPSTPDPAATRARAQQPFDKENMPPPNSTIRAGMLPSTPAGTVPGTKGSVCFPGDATTPARSSCMTPASKPGGATGMSMLTSTPLTKAPAVSACTPSGQTGTMPKSLEEWHDVLIALPTATSQDRARLFRLYERALGSGGGSEELDVTSHKDNYNYISLWLRRIRLDPDEGASYMKFMRKWHIGRKCAAVYVQQALTAPEKAAKALQEGIDAGAQPSDLLISLQRKVFDGQSICESCSEALQRDGRYTVVRTMLGMDTEDRKQYNLSQESGETVQFGKKIADVAHAAPSAVLKVRVEASGDADGDTLVSSGKAQEDKTKDQEETVSFGGKLTEAKHPLSDDTNNVGRRSSRRTAPTKEDTVIFTSQAPALAAKSGSGVKTDAAALKRTAVRGIKRTGLGSGPARRIVPGEENVTPTDAQETHTLRGEAAHQERSEDQMARESQERGTDSIAECDPSSVTESMESLLSRRTTGKKMLGTAHVSSLSGAGCSLSLEAGSHNMAKRLMPANDNTKVDEMPSPTSDEIPTRSMAGAELTPINEGEGACSGSEVNSSISSGGSNDSVNRTAEQPQGEPLNMSIAISDLTTKPQPTPHATSSFADEPTQPLRREQDEGLDLFFEDMACQANTSKEERQIALCKGHRAQYTDDQVAKGHIAVCAKIYKKIGVVGKGGGGKVYKVHLVEDSTSVWAIKKIKLNGDEELKDSVFNEIELLLRLRGHSCIIHMLDYEIGEDYVYMVMECGEQDLAMALQKRQVKSLRGIWRAMIDSVQVVHDERVVHGDLKPANFLMVKKDLKLIDFGIAKEIESENTTNIVRDNAIGTLNYMAPEAFLGNEGAAMGRKADGSLKLGRPSDVWSMGCILYQMVYGKPPFHNIKNTVHKMQAITSSSHMIEFPTSCSSGPVEPELLDVLRTTLERDPAKRPTIPQLRSHPWLVPVKYALDSYNILVMVAKVRSLHKEHKDISDSQIRDELLRLMKSAGLAIQEPPPPPPSKNPALSNPSLPTKEAPAMQLVKPPPPPPPPGPLMSAPKASRVTTESKIAGASAGGVMLVDIERVSATLKPATALNNVTAAGSSAPSGVPSQGELLAQRNKLKKVSEGLNKAPPAIENNDMAGALRERMQYIRSRVADHHISQNSNTGDFTSDFTKTLQ